MTRMWRSLKNWFVSRGRVQERHGGSQLVIILHSTPDGGEWSRIRLDGQDLTASVSVPWIRVTPATLAAVSRETAARLREQAEIVASELEKFADAYSTPSANFSVDTVPDDDYIAGRESDFW